ncbi:proline dehydrogenase family protein [Hoyosella sp. YIM 151337]|uniref:proline dehydrogenase family protein n=1 Tax=Hoyosella sp. YIM 151337 TaxID=2992742 RepID=UPI0022355E4D|nr:proline dehydrogenase family protein [Hoyosella sp. YIM 151337]MCW4354833.1 proline dehydrogenase family protein [Hoyosella sp. YIM 151337]
MLRRFLLSAVDSPGIRRFTENSRMARPLVDRFIAGESFEDALPVVRDLAQDRCVSLDHLGELTTDDSIVRDSVDIYREVLGKLSAEGLSRRVELSVKLSSLGSALTRDAFPATLAAAQEICAAAEAAGTFVTVDMEGAGTTDLTLSIVRELRRDFPQTGLVLQAHLHRTETDCREFANAGARVRLCKGAYQHPSSAVYATRDEIRESYRRCLSILMSSEAYPMVATHDPVLINTATQLAERTKCGGNDFEYQMFYGIRLNEQARLAESGAKLRVYVPFGTEWYPYFMRRLAEHPSNLFLLMQGEAAAGPRPARTHPS